MIFDSTIIAMNFLFGFVYGFLYGVVAIVLTAILLKEAGNVQKTIKLLWWRFNSSEDCPFCGSRLEAHGFQPRYECRTDGCRFGKRCEKV